MTHLSQISRIDVRPSVTLPLYTIDDISVETGFVFIWRYHGTDSKDVNVDVEAACEAFSYGFYADFRHRVCVHGTRID